MNRAYIESRSRKKPEEIYGGEVKAALANVWQIFDNPCGQRLKPLLTGEVGRLRKMGEFIAELGRNITRIELLPFHSYGAAKYTKPGRRWKLARLETPLSEHIVELKGILVSTGVDVQIGEAA